MKIKIAINLNPKINKVLSGLNEQINFIDLEIDDPIQKNESALNIILTAIEKLKIVFEKENIKAQEQEIDFFLKCQTKIYFKTNLLQCNF